MRRLLAILIASSLAMPALASSRTSLRNICRVKGQEENVLNGFGLVVGLNGTGEAGDRATLQRLARAMELLGSPVSMTGRIDEEALKELSKIKNVALVMVTATVPATGARRGDKIDCHVSAINGKGLLGGRLAFAALKGPNTKDPRVFGLCQGSLLVDDPTQPMVGRVHGGCQVQQDVFTPFYLDGYITLVLDDNHADFQIAHEIAHQIQERYSDQYDVAASGPYNSRVAPVANTGSVSKRDYDDKMQQYVHAIDAANIRIKIPDAYLTDPVAFTAELLEISIYEAEPEARVVVNPRSGSIVISGDVQIGDVVVAHQNLTVEAAAGPGAFAKVETGDVNQPRLDRLVTALSELKVPAEDIIEIIQGIDRLGKLHGKLIIE